MKRIILVLTAIAMVNCKGNDNEPQQVMDTKEDSTLIEEATSVLEGQKPVQLSLEQANKLAQLPLDCINVEYPNKLNQTLANSSEIGEPKELHPAFYGCFDWHSSVHGHWTLVSLLKRFPELKKEQEIREKLQASLSAENIQAEVQYFQNAEEGSYERTYGWAWLLKLAEELHTWDDPLARELEQNLQPLTDLITTKFKEFLPKLVYPIRVGEHTNTAFALSLAYDYAKATGKEDFQKLIEKRAKDFYLNDDNCPLAWEPSGFDFLSPCFSEIDIMRRVLPENAFRLWMEDFMPQLKTKEFALEVAEVSDRTDGKLVHLDGLNFSRAWVLHGLANQYPKRYSHLKTVANQHISYSFPNLVGDTYEGGHWLGSFALYALQETRPKQ
ncbi:DUF2891 domain-containing protein [Salinimicrobium catena]|uniref:DUF2891 domain-containing protein n=1 Tax=Salinimicrobium catena TaxID=390640 RepID=UPI002FE487D2